MSRVAYRVEFLATDLTGKIAPICGSDGTWFPDGRYGLTRIEREASAMLDRSPLRQRGVRGFRIVTYPMPYGSPRVHAEYFNAI